MRQLPARLLVLWTALGVVACDAPGHDFVPLPGWLDATRSDGRIGAVDIVNSIEPIARQLRRNWPQTDGNHRLLGPVQAYPEGAPTTLLLLRGPHSSLGEHPSRLSIEPARRDSDSG